MGDREAYILGTDTEELERLRFQHRVWSKEAFALWERSGLGPGQRILDLGCGPGFATFDLATVAGPRGRVLGIDKSAAYIGYARSHAKALGLGNIEFMQASFDDMQLDPGSFDAIYSRWAFAWINNVEEVVRLACGALKPGGVFLSQEYLNWGNFRIVPDRAAVSAIIAACRESWRRMDSEIDIAAALPAILRKNGLTTLHMAPLCKLAKPGQMAWEWPASFLKIYSLKLIEMGLLTATERAAFLAVWPEVEADPDSLLIGPLMMEIVAAKKA